MTNSYKVQPPLRYPGSKYRAYKFIEPFINNYKHEEFREPFFGSGAVFFQKKPAEANWINDLDPELINFYRVIQDINKAKMLADMVSTVMPTKDYFIELKESNPTDELSRAFKYFVINRTAYSGIMHLPNWGFHATKSVQPSAWPERILNASKKLQGVKITEGKYQDVLFAPTLSKKVLFFLDPPYYAADQKRAYEKSFDENEHFVLAENLKKIDECFILTYDDCDQIRRLYDWANIYSVEFMYHTANSCVTTRKKGKELIITNKEFDIEGIYPDSLDKVINVNQQLNLFDMI